MPPTIRKSVPARPVQFTPFTKEHLTTDSGIAFFNQWAAQVVNELNRGSGQSGPVAIPAGIDLSGGKLTGLSAPTDPSDAVSLAHADARYSPAVASPELDIGGKHALKGLTSLFLKVGQVQQGLPNNYTGGSGLSGAVNLFGLVVQFGLIPDMDSASFPMDFPAAFPNACQAIIASTIGNTDRITYVVTPALPAPPLSKTQFTLANNGSGVGACWIALGY